MKSQETLVMDTNVDEEKDTPPKKKLKQARLPFQIIASPLTVPQIVGLPPSVITNKKRRLSSDSDEIQIVKVVKNDASVIEFGPSSLTEYKENLCKDSVTVPVAGKNDSCQEGTRIVDEGKNASVMVAGKNDSCQEGARIVDEVAASSTTSLINNVNKPQDNASPATVPKTDQDSRSTPSETEHLVPVVVKDSVETDSEDVCAAETKHVLEATSVNNDDANVSIETDVVLVEESESDEHTELADYNESEIESKDFSEEHLKTPKLKSQVQDESGSSAKKMTPRQLQKAAEKEKLREEKQKLKQEKEDLRKKEREQKEEQKKKEREQKEDQRKKEREDKEDQKRKEKEDRDRKKQAELDLKNEEKRAKDEEKRKKEQADEDAKNKIAKKFTSFFVARKSESKVVEEVIPKAVDSQNFMPFQVKNDMRLAPLVRTDFTNKTSMDNAVDKQAAPVLYLQQLKGRCITTSGKTWPLSEYKNEVIILDAVDKSTEPANGNMLLVTETGTTPALRPKLLQFHENRRPPYWGTWRKASAHVRPTHPFGKDEKAFDYDVDSDDEWEEEEPGESLHGSDDEKESVDDYEIDNEFFVPHGYLSDEENEEEEMEVMSPETQKAKLKVLEIEFEEEMKHKMERIKPRLLGCFWANKHSDIAGTQLMKLLASRQAVCHDGPIKILLAPSTASGSPSRLDDAAGGHSPAGSLHSTKKAKLPSEAIPSLVQLVHGNSNSRAFLVKEFSAYWSGHSESHGKPLGSGEVLSSRGITSKITELANWMPCLDEGPLLGRMCWYVSHEVRSAHGLSDLPTPNAWKYTLQPRRNKETVPDVAASGSPAPTTPKLVPLITNFTKTVTPEERQKQFQQTANGHIVPPAHASAGPKLSLITKFTKVLSQEERESQLKQSAVDKLSSPAVASSSLTAKKVSQTSGPKKRASILVSVPRGHEMPKNSNNLMNRFVTINNDPSSANHSAEQIPPNSKNECKVPVEEEKCERMDVDCIVLSD